LFLGIVNTCHLNFSLEWVLTELEIGKYAL
jgi:hypothetical protein